MAWHLYYAVNVLDMRNPPLNLFQAVVKGEVFVGPSFRLAGEGGMAMLDSEELADQVKQALTPDLQRRHGKQTILNVVRWETTARVADKIKAHSENARAKLAQRAAKAT
ncbi:hypothetical protein CEK28_08645 [Xenophilus sp. AP218F]|nr:hypothetical protein CEK28_08645 [Xenophilus sp. AP218F]